MRRMLLLLVLLTGAEPAMAQVVRTSLKPETAVLGQPVRVFVDVLFPGEMPRPPRVALPDMPGAQILRYREPGHDHQRAHRRQGPCRAAFRVRALSAARRQARDPGGSGHGARRQRRADRPGGGPAAHDRGVGAGGRRSLAPRSGHDEVHARAAVEPPADRRLQGGRRACPYRSRARRPTCPAMAMLDLVFAAPPGVRVYVDPPQADDRIERGDLTGRRTDRATYVFERGGSFPIEAVVQPWWDLEAGRLRRAEGSGATVSVTAAPVSPPAGDRVERWVFFGATAAGLLALLAWLWPRTPRLARRASRTLASVGGQGLPRPATRLPPG